MDGVERPLLVEAAREYVVLRRAYVPVAGRALGVEVPEWVRSAADVPSLHWP